jgi:hypothetical protein
MPERRGIPRDGISEKEPNMAAKKKAKKKKK